MTVGRVIILCDTGRNLVACMLSDVLFMCLRSKMVELSKIKEQKGTNKYVSLLSSTMNTLPIGITCAVVKDFLHSIEAMPIE